MEYQELQYMNLSAPNLIVVCVDDTDNDDIGGWFYHCYGKEPAVFGSIIELMTKADRFFDEIAFPQASTQSRSFVEKKKETENNVYNRKRPEKRIDTNELLSHRGAQATFAISVRFRQRSTWQGELIWLEKGEKVLFTNMLELVSEIDKMLLLRKNT